MCMYYCLLPHGGRSIAVTGLSLGAERRIIGRIRTQGPSSSRSLNGFGSAWRLRCRGLVSHTREHPDVRPHSPLGVFCFLVEKNDSLLPNCISTQFYLPLEGPQLPFSTESNCAGGFSRGRLGLRSSAAKCRGPRINCQPCYPRR